MQYTIPNAKEFQNVINKKGGNHNDSASGFCYNF